MVRTKEFWVYQRSIVTEPWAIDFVVEYDKAQKMPYAYRWDIYLYAEWIPGTHCDSSERNMTFRTGDELAYCVSKILNKYGRDLNDMDTNHLVNVWLDILISC